MRRRPLEACVCAILAATVVGIRTIGNSAACLTADDAFSWRVTQRPLAQMLKCVARDTHPPGYFMLLKGWVTLWGDSPVALRGMSAFFGVIAVVVVYMAAATWTTMRTGATNSHGCSANWPWLSAALAALGSQQIEASWTARMYSQGALCCALSQYFLSRALSTAAPSGRGLFGYALAAAAFLYTHHYAVFTITAQAVFVLAVIVRRYASGDKQVGRSAAGYALALLSAFALYSPWAPVLAAQARCVDAGFCESGAALGEVSRSFAYWCVGCRNWHTVWTWCWLAFAAIGVAAAFRATPFGASFFCCQAVVPWLLCLRAWPVGAPVIVADRYFTFAQLSLFCLWGIGWRGIKGPVKSACYATAMLDSWCPARATSSARAWRNLARWSQRWGVCVQNCNAPI